jgi:hypothetical protein
LVKIAANVETRINRNQKKIRNLMSSNLTFPNLT